MSTTEAELIDAAIGFLDNALPAAGNQFDGPGYAFEYYNPDTYEIGDAEHGSLHAFEQYDPNVRPKPVRLGKWINAIAEMNRIQTTDREVGFVVDLIEAEKQRRGRHG